MSTTPVEQAALESPPPAPALAIFDLSRNDPIRAELYSGEHLEAHARELARSARLARGPVPGDPLLRRFNENGRKLTRAHRLIVEATARQEPITPDAEWLLDNFHIIVDTLREVRQDLPRGYYRELPTLADGPFAGLPRVYALGIELIAHTDSGLDETTITRAVQAYQTVAPLTIGELWAVPIMLRLGLLENLRRLADQMLQTWAERRLAQQWAARLAPQGQEPADPSRDGDAWSRMPDTWSDPCLVCLFEELRDRGPDASASVERLEQALNGRGIDCAEVLRREHQRQAANQVSVGNCVTSLRLLSNLDWAVFFERTSLAEALLREDPAGVYARQDFATKDRYRRTVEKLARGSGHDELEVIRSALALAQRGRGVATGQDHVGYYLIGPGRAELEAELSYRPGLGERIRRAILSHPDAFYFGSLGVVLMLLLAGLLAYGGGPAGWAVPVLLLVAAAVLLPASELAVGLVHYLITLILPPRVLPKLDFKDGVPADCATFVVMPTLLLREESAAVLTERLEVHYLSNPDPNLYFALLTDFADAPEEHQPEDDEYVRRALERIQALNRRYAPHPSSSGGERGEGGGPDRFFLFHRRRLWNPSQGCWMGWERKRGKLCEFNRLLRGDRTTSYSVISGDLSRLPPIRYVITLDADTQLPRETARRLIATLAHPLNRPRFDPIQGRVVEGHGVLQPRVSLSLVAGTRSLFSRILASSAGIDPYTTAVSDVYQDLFGRGSYTGKGIYDVDAFEAAVGHTFPDNHILSHDLIEGNYARCGLVTDIELLDDFPARYHAYARREHRWIRGDWQLLPWLFNRVPGSSRPNPLPALERWKVFDNLRRSLVPPALVGLFALAWTVLPGSPWFWTALALTVLALPLLLFLLSWLIGVLRGGPWTMHLREMEASFPATAGQVLLKIAFLADQAYNCVDAIGRTLVRLFITRRNLLEWETAATTERRLGSGFVHFCATMWLAPVLAAVLG
ncbi:MAG TPA: glycosyl transferase family 36, partial [Gemmataceae bacterium]|nr:glycosyl transferase family 36 [Gemmataceae bacterium]